MKTKILYLLLIATMLLSACSRVSAATNQSADAPVAQTTEVSPAVAQDKAAPAANAQGQADAPGGGIPPAEAIAACVGKAEQAACEFTSNKGAETGLCETVQNQLACSPQRGPADGTQPDSGPCL